MTTASSIPRSRPLRARVTALYTTWHSPLGELLLGGDEHALYALHFRDGGEDLDGWTRAESPFAGAVTQIEEYFAGRRTAFDLALAPVGSDFDRSVWARLAEIPYGQTRSYAEIARALGRPDRVRAVGGANARNPLAIIVPCHRVIGSDGSLTGYAGGLHRKRALLALESGAWQETLL